MKDPALWAAIGIALIIVLISVALQLSYCSQVHIHVSSKYECLIKTPAGTRR